MLNMHHYDKDTLKTDRVPSVKPSTLGLSKCCPPQIPLTAVAMTTQPHNQRKSYLIVFASPHQITWPSTYCHTRTFFKMTSNINSFRRQRVLFISVFQFLFPPHRQLYRVNLHVNRTALPKRRFIQICAHKMRAGEYFAYFDYGSENLAGTGLHARACERVHPSAASLAAPAKQIC